MSYTRNAPDVPCRARKPVVHDTNSQCCVDAKIQLTRLVSMTNAITAEHRTVWSQDRRTFIHVASIVRELDGRMFLLQFDGVAWQIIS